jgi:rubrerythrin
MRGCDCDNDDDDESPEGKRYEELEKVRYLGQAIEAIHRAVERHPDEDQDLLLDEAIQKIREARTALRAPVLWCTGCGFEWDGRTSPRSGRGCNHEAMFDLWSDIRRTGVTRGKDEAADAFVRRVKDTVYGILPRPGQSRS